MFRNRRQSDMRNQPTLTRFTARGRQRLRLAVLAGVLAALGPWGVSAAHADGAAAHISVALSNSLIPANTGQTTITATVTDDTGAPVSGDNLACTSDDPGPAIPI